MIVYEDVEVKIEVNELGFVRIRNKRSSVQIQGMIVGDDILLRTIDKINQLNQNVIAIEKA